MDNNNGINQFEVNQMNQSNQNQYIQQNYNQYQQVSQNYINGDNSCKSVKTKKKWLKRLLIIGIPTVAIMIGIILFLVLRTDYNIDESRNFAIACSRTFNTRVEEIELDEISKKLYGYETCYGTVVLGGVTARWYEFDSKEAAERYFNCEKFSLRRSFSGGSIIPGDINFEDNYVELSEVRDAEKVNVEKTIVILKDEYVVYLRMNGDKKEVERLKETFLEAITD